MFNILAAIQLVNNAAQLIKDATYPTEFHKQIAEQVKNGLTELGTIFQNQHDAQIKAQQEAACKKE